MMKNSRRAFIKQAGLTGISAMTIPLSSKANIFNHPVQAKQNGKVILFQGDSITDGNRTRNNDWNHIMGHGYAYLIASRLWYDYPDRGFMFYNRGVSGDRVKDLEARWEKDALDLKPDIISILVGVNDVIAIVTDNDPESIQLFEERYQRLLDRTHKAMPDTKIVFMEPFTLPLGWLDQKPEVWKKEIPPRQLIVKNLAEKNGVAFIELQKPFNEACEKAPADYWIWDGVHPMPAGHELIARQWITKMKDELEIDSR